MDEKKQWEKWFEDSFKKKFTVLNPDGDHVYFYEKRGLIGEIVIDVKGNGKTKANFPGALLTYLQEGEYHGFFVKAENGVMVKAHYKEDVQSSKIKSYVKAFTGVTSSDIQEAEKEVADKLVAYITEKSLYRTKLLTGAITFEKDPI